MPRRWWGDPLISEDLRCSLMFKISSIHLKNKFIPLSLLHAEELDRSAWSTLEKAAPAPA